MSRPALIDLKPADNWYAEFNDGEMVRLALWGESKDGHVIGLIPLDGEPELVRCDDPDLEGFAGYVHQEDVQSGDNNCEPTEEDYALVDKVFEEYEARNEAAVIPEAATS